MLSSKTMQPSRSPATGGGLRSFLTIAGMQHTHITFLCLLLLGPEL